VARAAVKYARSVTMLPQENHDGANAETRSTIIGARLRKNWLAVASLVVVVVAAGVLLLIQPWTSASATPNTSRYTESATFVSKNLSICINARMTGTITYKAARSSMARGERYSLTSIRLIDPVETAEVHVWQQGAGCTATNAHVSHLTLGQHWASDSGKQKLASYTTPFGPGETFTQNNTGSASTFANLVSIAGAPALCYRATIQVSYGGRNASNSSVADGGSAVKRICLTPMY
jgi:hypothetical protein